MSMLRVWLEYAWSMARVWLEYAYSMPTVCLETKNLFPYGEQNIPTLGTKHSQPGNKTGFLRPFSSKRAELERRLVMSMLLLLMVGVNGAWGQAGVWYIANDNTSDKHPGKAYSQALDTEKYYLVPAANPQQQNAIDAYYSPNYNTADGDSEKPFLATALSNKDLNSIWIVKESGETGYYFIIHARTGKYVIYEVPLPNDPNTNTNGNETSNGKRKTMHLQTIDNGDYNPSTNDNFKFAITTSGGGYNIRPKRRNGWYWNPAGQNNDVYYGQSSGENTNLYRNGLVGVYNNAATNSIWHFETASSATTLTPVISDVQAGTNTFTITSPAAAFSTIRYTTDGSTTPNASTGTNATSGSPITITENWTVQAVGVFDTFVTPVAGPKELALAGCAKPIITYDYATSTVSITCPTADASIYYKTDGSDPTNGTQFSSAFPVSDGMIIKAIAKKSGLSNSDIASLTIVLNPTINIEGGPFTYNGTQQQPAVTVKKGDDVINPTEYQVSYGNNIDVGNSATVTISDVEGGEYYVAGSTTFTISPMSIGSGSNPVSGITIDVVENGGTYSVIVKHNDKTLIEGTDYEWNGGTVGEDYVVTVTGKGNYSGTAQATYVAATPGYYVLHQNGKGYLKVSGAGVNLGNDETFQSGNLFDKGNCIWYMTPEGYLQNEYFYLNAANNNTLYLSVNPVTRWRSEDVTGENTYGKKHLKINNGTEDLYLCNDDNSITLKNNPSAYYSACPVDVEEVENSWAGPTAENLTVQSPQLVTYLRAYFTQKIKYTFHNDAGAEVKSTDGKHERRVYATIAYKEGGNNKGTDWDIDESGILYNKKASGDVEFTATYNILPADPVARAAHPTPATKDIKYKVTKKPLTFTENMDYLLYSISGGDSYRYPYDDGIADGGAVKPDGKGGTGDTSVLTDPDTNKNLQISWKITADEEGFYTFQNSSTGKYLYYDETAHTSSDFGVLRLSNAPTGNSAKFRLYKTSDTNYSECYYLIPYSKLFAVYKSNAVADGLYVALNNKDYTGDTPVISLSKPNANSTWCIYKYEAEYRIREDFTITGPSSAEAVGNYNITSEGWYGRYIKQSPRNGSGQRGLVIKGTYKDNVDYIWTVTGLGNYINISDGTNTDGTWSKTTNGNANNRKLVVNVTSLPVSTTSGVITLKLSGCSAPNTNVKTSSEKTFAFTILGDGAISFTDITSLAGITSSSGAYRLVGGNGSNFAYSDSNKPGITTFSGVLDGNNQTISGLNAPLFDNLSNGTVRNVNLSGVGISNHSGPTGAIAGTADGGSRIYNVGILGGEVGSNGDVCGGLVGKLDGSARVINCFSYATITGGTTVGGIVGNNTYASKSNDMRTMVMNCMFYGDITGGNSKAPIYNGQIITNRSDENGVGNFNYFWAGASYVQGKDIDVYNCALSAETRFLQRFEFFRHLLNSNRALAAWWAMGSRDKKNEMLKWVLEPSQIGTATPYPILKPFDKYPSVVNIDADHAEDFSADADTKKTQYNQGRKFGTLTINIQNATSGSGSVAPSGANITTLSVTPNITDKDPAHFNFNYYKVQLPYYNDVGTKNYTDNKVVTGWKIVTISGGTNTYSTDNDNDATTPADATASVNDNGDITLTTPYNFADRKCTDKDKFEVSGRVFSQGAYFDVPEGVSSITIEPYWGKCVYVSDQYPDVVYNQGMSTAANVTTVGGGERYKNGNAYDINGSSQKVYTSMGNAVTALNPSGSVYDNAIVLVGNVHSLDLSNKTDSKPYTIMSIDLDSDNEPDYSYILRFNNRNRVHPVRIDFLNVIGLGMAQKSKDGTGTYNFGIMQPFGWFECTNTGLFRVTQLEYDYKGQNGNAPRLESPMILQGGVIEQWVTVGGKEAAHKEAKSVTYYHVGGNVWFKEFHIGVHQDKTENEFISPHPPISVTGGDFDEFYLTGMYNTPNTNYPDNAECYINGGRFGKVAGTGMQGLGNAEGAGVTGGPAETGNIIWQIDHADIDEFYAGGINAAHIATGNIRTVISNSRVDQFCGGPKFGNMTSNKTVVTNATNCTFRTFFGAGYGGNSYNRRYPFNRNDVQNTDWNGWVSSEYTNKYDSNYGGVETRIDYQFIPMSSNTSNVARLYVDYVNFSLATTYDVTSKLTDCTITTSTLGRLELFSQSVGNFYGGGSLGMVAGPVKSTLTNCTVEGNVFGGGYSATLPTVAVMNNSFQTPPYYDSNLGAYLDAVLPNTVAYTWEHATEAEFNTKQIDTDNHILYTTETLTGLGAVTGNVTLTIDGNTTLTNGKRMSVSHSVYGGGEESNVSGNTEVNITGGTITENVFGGGKGEADEFSCSKAMIGVNNAGAGADLTTDENKNKGTKVTISNGIVNGNVYGGGEVGRVEWNTQVKIGVGTGDGPFAPEINGSVFGAGKGKETHGYAALVRGNSSVTIQGNAKVLQNVYGGGEQATVGRYWVKGVNDNVTGAPTAPTATPDEMPYQTMSGGKCTVVVQGSAQVGPDSNVPITAGHVFGAGKGVTPNYVHTGDKANWSKRMVDYNSTKHTSEGKGTTWDYYEAYTEAQIADNTFPKYVWEYFVDDADQSAANYKSGEDKYLGFLQTLALVTGTDVTIDGSAKVKGSVYGGSESGYVQDNTNVKVSGGTIGTENLGGAYYGNVYGGGKGDAEHTGTNNNYVAAGLVKGNTKVTIENTGTGENAVVPFIRHNVYGGGAYGSVGQFTYDATTGLPTGRLQSTTGGKAEVIIKGGIFGTTGSENGMIFGSSRGDVGAEGSIHDKLAWVYETDVKIGTENATTGPAIKGSVYGGGENGHVFTDAAVYIYSGTVGITEGEQITDDNGTPENQTDDKTYTGAAYPYRGNVYGSGCGTDKYYSGAIPEGHTATDGKGNKYNPLAGIVQGNTTVNISGGHVVHNVYGAGAMGSVGTASVATSGKTTITVTGGRIGYDGTNNEGNIFGAARGDLAATGDNLAQVRETEVNINKHPSDATKDPAIWGSVFGGGEAGTVKESVAVYMTGGLIHKDVYGGGALAHTQTSNWNATGGTGGKGDWATGKTSASSTTTVRLTGGTILGEAYGGALGEKTGVNGATSDIAAYVYGDVLLDLNGTTSSGETGAAIDNTAKGCAVGQVFGCNNINGTPKGDVMVHVYATQNKQTNTIAQKFILEKDSNTEKGGSESDADYVARLQGILTGKIALAEALNITVSQANKDLCTAENPAVTDLTTAITGIVTSINAKSSDAINGVRYDVEAVYGGGNMAAYVPATPYNGTTGSKTQVIIEGCSKTSIETVYGGGNAAAVPETNVEIREAYEIQAVFGGGNGKDNLPNGDPNPGADIGQYNNGTSTVTDYGTGDANSTLKGGYIHEAYGGSNTKGVVKGNLNQTSNPGTTCTLIVEKIVGAGKYADIDGDVNMTLSCQPSSKVDLLFAGADEANVNGNITLNITNGHFGKVFGGNNLGGAVKGKITVNVKETECQPIKIDELYLGGNEAAYSVFGYYESDDPVTGLKILKPRTSATDPNLPVKLDGTSYTSIDQFTNYAQPELNIISCTYIGKVFGGGLGAPATMYASPTVNVNMEPGTHAATAVSAVMTSLGLDVTKTAPNPQNLGIIGDVFGGGNEADIVGNTTVNIAVEYVVKQVNVGASVTDYYTRSGAGTTADPFVYTAATGTAVEGKTYYEKKAAQGSAYIIGSVFGGGNAADVLGNTNVTMSDGYVFNGIFGGGYAGSVGTFTRRTDAQYTSVFGHTAHDGCIGKPISCAEGTGKCTVLVNGGQIGPISVAKEGMNRSVDDGGPVPEGWVWGAGQGLVEDPAEHPDTHFTSYVGSTDVTIGGTALIMESIIGGGEFGRVLGNTLVKIEGGQIGVGAGMVQDGKPVRYDDDNFIDPSTATAEQINAKAALMPECSHFPYGNSSNEYLPYDPYYSLSKYSTYVSSHTDFGPASTTSPSDGKTWIGCVFGGGSGYMPYEKEDGTGYDWCPSAGLVEGDAEVRISGGHILTNVYGGNEVTDVKGKSIVKMTGGTIGVPRTLEQIVKHPLTCYLFGAGKGDERSRFYNYTNTGSVEVEISGGIIYGSVFGGSEDGHVTGDIDLTIRKGDSFTIGSTTYTNGPIIGTWGTSYVDGNVFGAGRGFSGNTLTAGNVGGNVTLNISGGNILGSVYGGGRLASVGTYLVSTTDANYGKQIPDNGNEKHGHITINISGGTIGNDKEYIYNPTAEQKAAIPNTTFDYQNHLQYTKGGNVFTAGMGRLYALDGKTVLTSWQKLGQCKSTTLNMSGGTVKSSVYGGGEIGIVAQNATLNINGGTVGTKVVDPNDATKYYYFGSVFGGGKGSTENIDDISMAGTTQGNVEVHLNKDVASDVTKTGAVVHQVFGCNDMNGSPKGTVTVHVYATQNADKDNIGTKYDKETNQYDVEAVYGGGNLAAYEPTDLANGKAKVIVDGCGLTSVRQVYGGGNAASTPATDVEVNGTYEILELFGGGNGADRLPSGADNPGANVGYKDYHLVEDDPAYATKEARVDGEAFAPYRYGTGEATVNIKGGTIHRVFGGSNTKGNVRKTALTLLEEVTNAGVPKCTFQVDEAYGGGKSAPMDAEAKLLMACIPGLKEVYGGAEAADIHDDVSLTITNGTFDRVFGGNNISGTISGKITVNVEETGCRPVVIGELYGGGNLAAYSIYGYKQDGDEWKPRTSTSDAGTGPTTPYASPQVNVRSFTSIGSIYGGGYGAKALMVASPTVNISESVGDPDTYPTTGDDYTETGFKGKTITVDGHDVVLPDHTKTKIGAINNVFGGGNAAPVQGDTQVNIGTAVGEDVYLVKAFKTGDTLPAECYTKSGNNYVKANGTAVEGTTYYRKYPVVGADIRGNVYGGGNNAEVTGNTNVNIGKKEGN